VGEEEIKRFGRYEERVDFRRVKVIVIDRFGRKVEAESYKNEKRRLYKPSKRILKRFQKATGRRRFPRIYDEFRPSKEYLDMIKKAARKRRFPDEWIKFLDSIKTNELERRLKEWQEKKKVRKSTWKGR
jgi:hypothetical protein